jgi:ATP:ADP antiporter, AAA family
VLGGAASQIFLALGGAFAVKGILLVSVGLAAVALYVTQQLQKLYVTVLEKGLLERAIELDVSTTNELMTRSVLLRTLSIKTTDTSQESGHPAQPKLAQSHPAIVDPVLQRLAQLRSGNPEVVRDSLAKIDQVDALLAPQLIVLLAWDEMSQDVLRTLRGAVDQITGQLVDSLVAENVDFSIRRRIPRALAYSNDRRAVEGMIRALNDSRFEVRFQCARALDAILQRNPEFRPARETIFAIVERELSVSRDVWAGRRLLDKRQSTDQFLFLDSVLRERANLSWEYLFSLLALILSREPLKVAFQALHTDDRMLHGLAVEYLDSVLPPSLRRVQVIFEQAATSGAPTRTQEVATRLMDAQQTVKLKILNAGSSPAAQKNG